MKMTKGPWKAVSFFGAVCKKDSASDLLSWEKRSQTSEWPHTIASQWKTILLAWMQQWYFVKLCCRVGRDRDLFPVVSKVPFQKQIKFCSNGTKYSYVVPFQAPIMVKVFSSAPFLVPLQVIGPIKVPLIMKMHTGQLFSISAPICQNTFPSRLWSNWDMWPF